jgi:hypothetical protein
MSKKQIKDIWGWLNEITLYKTPIENISEESWDKWNSYMINRYVSMDIRYIELANYIQTIPYDNKQQIYQIYREMIPKQKTFLKYVKSRTKKQPAILVEYIAKYFECSLGEAEEYIDILRKNGVRSVLYEMGIEDKEVEKLLK